MADPLEAIRKDMQQKPPEEFICGQRHHFLLLLVLIVLVGESDLSVFQTDQPVVGDGHAMRVAAEVIQNSFGTPERRLGVDHPFRFVERRSISRSSGRIRRPMGRCFFQIVLS